MGNKIIQGTVIHGNGLGRTVGMPTANLDFDRENLNIENGVYATRVKIIVFRVNGETEIIDKYGVTNVGLRPTVDNFDKVSIETYILDFNDMIYGQTMHIEFVKKLRDIKKFSDLEALKEQVDKDIVETRKILGE